MDLPPVHGPARRAAPGWWLFPVLVAVALVAAACGGGGDRTLAGITRDPEPVVDATPLPDLSNSNQPFTLRADAGGLLIVYFGYTHCPDICPTTLADISQALQRMNPELAARVQLAMITVDPGRDLPVLTSYVQTFVRGAHALGTDDPAALQAAAEPFGVSYQVTTGTNGEIDVSHSTQSFVVDANGNLVLTWTFGTPASDVADDLTQLLDDITT
jgi:protein SCO1